jgi:hypothetical protein
MELTKVLRATHGPGMLYFKRISEINLNLGRPDQTVGRRKIKWILEICLERSTSIPYTVVGTLVSAIKWKSRQRRTVGVHVARTHHGEK